VNAFGAIEIGGTKTDLAVGTSFDDLSEPTRIPTSDPKKTLDAVGEFFDTREVDAVGVASFGPLDLEGSTRPYGTILLTPKAAWSGTPLHHRLRIRLGVPVAIDTDVNGAAMGEGRWGATKGMRNHAYVTVGTGIGAGIVVDAEVLKGERHPEMGHIVVSRLPGDTFEGICPYHGDCLEGMAAGPALEARFGGQNTWPGNDNVVALVVHYLAQGLVSLVYTVAPQRIVVGGGVSRLPGLHNRLRGRVGGLLAGYPDTLDLDLLISQPGLGEKSGLAGAILLASTAVG
jgi:fructokinase